jgi:hypothetical protein
MGLGMPRFKPKGVLERTAVEDLWKHTLSRIPTIYGRLTYLASLRDTNSGVYRHHGLAAVFGREESGKALRISHAQAFLEWINLPLAEKSEDLTCYFATLDDPSTLVAEHLLTSGVYRSQAPDSARQMEREFFCSDLEALLELIRNQPGGGGSFPPPSPHE